MILTHPCLLPVKQKDHSPWQNGDFWSCWQSRRPSTNLGHVFRLFAGSAKFCVPGISHNGDVLWTFKRQQNLSGNIVRILPYIACTRACIAHTYWNVHMTVTKLYVFNSCWYVYVHACECGEKMPNDYQMTIVCVQFSWSRAELVYVVGRCFWKPQELSSKHISRWWVRARGDSAQKIIKTSDWSGCGGSWNTRVFNKHQDSKNKQ